MVVGCGVCEAYAGLTVVGNPLMMDWLAFPIRRPAAVKPAWPQDQPCTTLAAPSFNGRTAASGAAYRGSNPWGAAKSITSSSPEKRSSPPSTENTGPSGVTLGESARGLKCVRSASFAPSRSTERIAFRVPACFKTNSRIRSIATGGDSRDSGNIARRDEMSRPARRPYTGSEIDCRRSEQFDGGLVMTVQGLAAGHCKVGDGLAGHSVSAFMGFQNFLEVAIEIPAPFGIEHLT